MGLLYFDKSSIFHYLLNCQKLLAYCNYYPFTVIFFKLSKEQLQYSFDFGTGHLGVSVAQKINASYAYIADVERFGLFSKLSIDGISTGPFLKYRLGDAEESFYMKGRKDGVFLGSGNVPVSPDVDFQGK